jgi:tetratricopeptide (TPR) repeat protein
MINKPDAVHDKQTEVLEKIVQEFPYFQSARALYLKGLYNQNSFKYNYALKITAAHTTDRSVLFDFITSDTFTAIQKGLYDKKVSEILDITVKESEVMPTRLEARENTIEQSIAASIKEAAPAEEKETEVATLEEEQLEPEIETLSKVISTPAIEHEENQPEAVAIETPEEKPGEKLEIGKPLEFSLTERHSFQEWLQLSKVKPIVRETENSEPEPQAINEPEEQTTSEVNFEKQKKNDLIDKFIETSPKIPQVKHDTPIPSIFYEPSKADNSFLMTETLARVYLEQKKYQKAIQAYEILILKYPEKSSFFADRILDIKNLQQNNNT